MAKSAAMMRCMARCKRMTPVPARMFNTPIGIFMARAQYEKLRRELAANDPTHSPMRFGGLPVHLSPLCEPFIRFDGYPLRAYAVRYLARHAQRRSQP